MHATNYTCVWDVVDHATRIFERNQARVPRCYHTQFSAPQFAKSSTRYTEYYHAYVETSYHTTPIGSSVVSVAYDEPSKEDFEDELFVQVPDDVIEEVDYEALAPIFDTYDEPVDDVLVESFVEDLDALPPMFDVEIEVEAIAPVTDCVAESALHLGESFFVEPVVLFPHVYSTGIPLVAQLIFQVVDSACVVPCCRPKLMLESRTTRILEGENDTSRASTFDPFREPFKEEDVVALCSSSRRPAPKPPWLTYVI